MRKCEMCGNEGSRMEANHKELGRIMVCQDCWSKLYDKNSMTCSVGSSGCSLHLLTPLVRFPFDASASLACSYVVQRLEDLIPT